MKTTGLTQQGMIQLFRYCLNLYSLDNEYAEAKLLHREYIDLLEDHIQETVGDSDDLNIELHNFKTNLNSQQIMAIYIYLVSVKHKIFFFGTSVLNIIPYITLKVDKDGSIYRDSLVYTLATAYGTFYNFKAMMKDDFGYLANTDQERESLEIFKNKIYELDQAQREKDPNNPNESYATELDTSCMR